mmetsp:Transcript_116725/g.362689  ORF Transcript_116725/g.362689 Transcript_116725/m.362689 type:complete len:242 (+) Transcript_116725:52-777(+)
MGPARMARCVLVLALAPTLTAAGTNEQGLKFLEENKEREGVHTLKSGLQYKVLKKGTGKYYPKKDSPCECHYAGTTPALTPNAIDLPEAEWKEFDSSYKRGEPTTFAPNQVIKGWTEAMQKMVEGDKWEMYIPSELGYGDSGSGDKIKGGDVLIFRMELMTIKGGKKRAAKCDLKTKENCEPDEVAILNDWVPKPIGDIEAEVKRISKLFEGTLKKGEREKLQPKLSMLKKLQKAKTKQEL